MATSKQALVVELLVHSTTQDIQPARNNTVGTLEDSSPPPPTVPTVDFFRA